MHNALTIDVEDWFHVCGIGARQPVLRRDHRVAAATGRILDTLHRHSVTATFFMLGSVAETEPELVQRIAAAGHELASHGWSHSLLHDLTPEQFEQELHRTEEVINALTGIRPVGFRAPQWSVSSRTPWVHQILASRGYRYDSSISPLPLIGDPRGSRVPYRIETESGPLWEVPPLVTPTWFGNLPTGGGWGFRFFPVKMIEWSVAHLNQDGFPAVIYLHPRDVDPGGPRLKLPPLKKFVAYGPANDALPRLGRLLERFRFTTVKELVGKCPTAS